MTLKLVAAPMPPTVDALGEAGDAYVAALRVRVTVHAADRSFPVETVDMPGERFEALVSALQLRHLAFNPRNRGFVPNTVKAGNWARRTGLHWPGVDAHAIDMPELRDDADRLAAAAKDAAEVSWTLV